MKHHYLKRILQVVIVAVLFIFPMAISVLAENCDHDWSYKDTIYEKCSDSEHMKLNHYYCANCGEEKEEISFVEHNWGKDAPENHIVDTVYSSKTYHTVTYYYQCYDCGEEKIVKEKEKHCFNKYNHCTKCSAVIPKNITLKPKEKAYINTQSWAKIKVSKKGYLKIYVNNDANWGLYDRYKLPYNDAQWMKFKMCVPVKKGTYYLKVTNDSYVKYTFTQTYTKNNGKRSVAINLKKDKGIITLAFPPAKKNTWTGYYKVKIPKKQFLRLLISDGYTTPGVEWRDDIEISIYNDKGKPIPYEGHFGTSEGSLKGITTYEKLKKGTYYIKLKRNYYSEAEKERCLGNVISLKWVNRRIW